jgi:hypothetical protein
MNKKQTIEMLEQQATVWNKIYTESKAKDAGLVLSVIESLLQAVKTGNGFAEGEYSGMVSCYGSEQLLDSVFKK